MGSSVFRLALHWQIALALALAVVSGALVGDAGWFLSVTGFLGELFLNALRMLIVPLIIASMINAVISLPDAGALSRLGLRTLAWILGTTLIAVCIGLVWVNLVAPGIIDGQPAGERLGLAAETSAVLESVEERGGGDVIGIFLRMIPPNVFEAAASGEMLGLIFFSLLFGFFASRLSSALVKTQQAFWQGVYEIMLRITGAVMLFAPIGVFALVAGTVARTGWDAFTPLILFFLTVVAALAMHAFLVLPLLVRLLAGVSPLRQLRTMAPAMLTAFSTSSSAATLPVTFDCVQRGAGVSPRTAGFVLPLGATVNMNGTALYECAAALFIAQAYGLELSFGMQFTVVVLALLTSIGVAGVPSASLVAIAVILGAIGLPLEGVGLILAVDRVLDMCRTSVNVFGDSCGAVIIARHDGEAVYPDSTAAERR
jgi:proton glutamate symport protein